MRFDEREREREREGAAAAFFFRRRRFFSSKANFSIRTAEPSFYVCVCLPWLRSASSSWLEDERLKKTTNLQREREERDTHARRQGQGHVGARREKRPAAGDKGLIWGRGKPKKEELAVIARPPVLLSLCRREPGLCVSVPPPSAAQRQSLLLLASRSLSLRFYTTAEAVSSGPE